MDNSTQTILKIAENGEQSVGYQRGYQVTIDLQSLEIQLPAVGYTIEAGTWHVSLKAK